MRTGSALKTGIGIVASIVVLVVALVVRVPAALAGYCFFVIDPPESQVQGLEITITGSFDFYPNKTMSIFLLHPEEGVIEKMEPGGTTDADSDFVETRTIPFDFPSGEVEVIVSPGGAVQEPSEQTSCSKDYRVDAFVLIPVTIVTATTSTTPSETTQPVVSSTDAPGTTVLSPTTVPDSIPPETTTVVDATTVTSTPGGGALDPAQGQGKAEIPGWMIVLVSALALALVGLGGWVLGQRSRGMPAGSDRSGVDGR